MFRNGLAVAVILLFIGVGIQPAIAKLSIITTSDNEDDCNLCPKVSNQHLVRLKSLISRLETLNTKLSVLSKHYPEFEGKYNGILNILNTDKILDNSYPLRCKILYEIMNRYVERCEKFLEKLGTLLGTLLGSTELAQRIVFILFEFLFLPIYPLMILYVLLLCENYPFPLNKLNISDFVMHKNILMSQVEYA